MTLVRDPEDTGFLVRLVKIYREKRRPQPVRVYSEGWGKEILRPTERRMPRRAAWQIAWHQARNAQGVR